MTGTRGRAALWVGVAVAVVLSATVVYLVYDRLQSTQISQKSIQPEFVTPVGADGSLTNVDVGFPWTEQGYCAGQFQVKATETRSQIRVGVVVSRTYSYGNCAGLGSNGKWATTLLTLRTPIGNRLVVRDGDGSALPVFALTVMLRCQDAIYSQLNPGSDQATIYGEVALPKDSLQANRSGEADPSAKLFAKNGLSVASNTSFMLECARPVDGQAEHRVGKPCDPDYEPLRAEVPAVSFAESMAGIRRRLLGLGAGMCPYSRELGDRAGNRAGGSRDSLPRTDPASTRYMRAEIRIMDGIHRGDLQRRSTLCHPSVR